MGCLLVVRGPNLNSSAYLAQSHVLEEAVCLFLLLMIDESIIIILCNHRTNHKIDNPSIFSIILCSLHVQLLLLLSR